jgi:hypothetical protein
MAAVPLYVTPFCILKEPLSTDMAAVPLYVISK